ncbi:MAG: hypothetical protein RX318_03765 [bacterium]|nr:hypothetical protein [bacterium]
MAEFLNPEEYLNTQRILFLMAHGIADAPLQAFINSIERAHAVGPILDPTMYREGLVTLRDVERLAQAALEFQRVVEEFSIKTGPNVEEIS